jgi:hypothetical protein
MEDIKKKISLKVYSLFNQRKENYYSIFKTAKFKNKLIVNLELNSITIYLNLSNNNKQIEINLILLELIIILL